MCLGLEYLPSNVGVFIIDLKGVALPPVANEGIIGPPLAGPGCETAGARETGGAIWL